ncbi:MAG: aminotransferase class III-fold pyridoxal phosphate-dependent enzyme [Acidobacteriota bacterium]|nr:MAG: aminotransferase class III-fold pyridoxal phosphate-dependent enzyme [Acidobacteriota bacterium]
MTDIRYTHPQFTEADAIRLAEELYGIRAAAEPLPSERDRNFRLTTEAGESFVLRISNHEEPREILVLQNHVLEHLAAEAPSVTVQRLIPAIDGRLMVEATGSDDRRHAVRLLSWLPGNVLAESLPHSTELMTDLGAALGEIDRALLDFDDPAADRFFKWDLRHPHWIRDLLDHIAQPESRALVERHLDKFESSVEPGLSSLRRSVIHADANDYNVLVGTQNGKRTITGIIDFGDLIRTSTVCEPAIAAAYTMLDKPDPIEIAAALVGGYHRRLPLDEQEIEVLFPLILMRLCVSVANSAFQQKEHPDNEYLVISEKPAWRLLERLDGISPDYAQFRLREACGLEPCPKRECVVGWLNSHSGEIGPLFEPALTAANTITFDLSVGSLEITNPAAAADVRGFSKSLFRRMRDEKAIAGIGRYDEARALYTSDIFKIEGNDGPEWRAIHLGLDIFMESGTPILAPLDGTVRSACINVGELDYGPTIILEHKMDEGSYFTLYGHLSEDSIEGLKPGRIVRRGEEIGRIGDFPANGNWPPHLHFQIVTDMMGYEGDFPGVCRPADRAVWLSVSPDPNLIARLPLETTAKREAEIDQLLTARHAHLGPNLSISYRRPLRIVRGWMQHLYDFEGRKFLDAVNNVPHVGHCHPRVVSAGQKQMAVLNTNTRYLHDNLIRYAERLCSTMPDGLSVCYLVNSGSEANELALRLARTHTRSRETIVVDVGYHGNTSSLIEISPYKHSGPGGSGPPPFVHTTIMPDVYRGPFKKDDPLAGQKYARHVAELIEKMESHPGAFICESILSCGGQIVLPEGYLQQVYRLVRETGGVCIADEVQTGFGRIGSHFHAFQTQGVTPDIVTLGKPIGNGHPLGAVVTTPRIAASFSNGMEYFNTFGGNPVSTAIGLAVLDVIEDEGLQENALITGRRLLDELRGLMKEFPLIGDVRGLGLFAGIELVRNRETLEPADAEASYIANRMRDRGVLLSTDGPFHNVLKIKPPMVFNRSDAEFLVDNLRVILREVF